MAEINGCVRCNEAATLVFDAVAKRVDTNKDWDSDKRLPVCEKCSNMLIHVLVPAFFGYNEQQPTGNKLTDEEHRNLREFLSNAFK
tara:strand:+ start:102 stop:359 length:258 start_codon:yes stop_codon:yes gene_type:complete